MTAAGIDDSRSPRRGRAAARGGTRSLASPPGNGRGDVADEGEAALVKARLVPYDVVVLDRHLPVLHGDEVCRRLVADGAEARILMLTAADSTHELVDGLDLGGRRLPGETGRARGARSPSMRALTSGYEFGTTGSRSRRSRAGPRQADGPAGRPAGQARSPRVRPARGAPERRRPRAQHGPPAPRLWDERFEPFDNTVRVALGRLRRKLGDPAVIETVTGSGYRIA
jgi:two-component system, OmpR family, response regulator VanR